ncbi:MAG TPA: outer membrane protein assembly factor BamD [Bryobacteraceae bacterium]|nr:outer membrane protein assembly factor BamD [Bryobacteraceae bacterium]
MLRFAIRNLAVLLAVTVLLSSCGIRRKKYANPISKDTQQPDKVLFDKAVDDIEHSRYERARLTLQTLMNTYDTSEYLAKAKLAIADSWYQEGGARGLAQAEAEYKDFILFYPAMEESAEAQEKICKMQFNQMDKSDRDSSHALRAEEECKQLVLQFPNSKFAPEAQQMLRNIQEVLADKEFRVGAFYHHKGSMPAAVNRLQGVANQFPLYSGADEALWLAADSYRRMGDKFENQQVDMLSRIVKDYPMSAHVQESKTMLTAMKRPVPDADPVRYAAQKYDLENRTKKGLLGRAWEPFAQHPDISAAAKSGSPQMTGFRPTIPASVPAIAAGQQGTSDVTGTVVSDPTAINNNPDARLNPGAAATPAPGNVGVTATTPGSSAPTQAVPGTPAGSAPSATAPVAPPGQPTQPIAVTRTGVDLNSAPEADIAKLPGINKLMAKRIVAMRPFLSVNDLIKTGLPKKTIDKLKPAPAGEAAKTTK